MPTTSHQKMGIFRSWLKRHYPAGANAAGLGLFLLRALAQEPGCLGQLVDLHIRRPHPADPLDRQRDLLPLPIPPEEWETVLRPLAESEVQRTFKPRKRGNFSRAERASRLEMGVCAWTVLLVLLLNFLSCGMTYNEGRGYCYLPATAAQTEALGRLRQLAFDFCHDREDEGAVAQVPDIHWEERLKGKKTTYKGESCEVAQAITARQIAPGLPLLALAAPWISSKWWTNP